MIDSANVYSFGASQEVTGRALRDFARREEVVIHLSREEMQALEAPYVTHPVAGHV